MLIYSLTIAIYCCTYSMNRLIESLQIANWKEKKKINANGQNEKNEHRFWFEWFLLTGICLENVRKNHLIGHVSSEFCCCCWKELLSIGCAWRGAYPSIPLETIFNSLSLIWVTVHVTILCRLVHLLFEYSIQYSTDPSRNLLRCPKMPNCMHRSILSFVYRCRWYFMRLWSIQENHSAFTNSWTKLVSFTFLTCFWFSFSCIRTSHSFSSLLLFFVLQLFGSLSQNIVSKS